MAARSGTTPVCCFHSIACIVEASLITHASSLLKFITHGNAVLRLALRYGWRAGARYTNLRDVRGLPFEGVGFLDIHFKRYDFLRHLAATAQSRPLITVARDVDSSRDLDSVLLEAEQLRRYSRHVVVVPKDKHLARRLNDLIPRHYILGFSVPTRYGATPIPPQFFTRPVHLLGGRPDVQRGLAALMPVVSIDCNRFTLDAQYGDYFDGHSFRPHPQGGYKTCLRASFRTMETLWRGYEPAPLPPLECRRH